MKAERFPSLDALRGLVMMIMALDHVREFFHADAMVFQPEDLTRSTPILFLTRWITHICAPVFAFTAGTGAYLWVSRGRTVEALSRFLWTRGLWLVFLDLVAVRLAMFFSLTSAPVILNVLWSLGWSMVILGFLVRLPVRVIASLSIATIVLHNAVRGPAFLHQPGLTQVGGVVVLAGYTLIPWFAVMAIGYCFGRILLLEAPQRRKTMWRLGASLTVAFVAIRYGNVYGDPRPWSGTLLSFLNTTKYPPSLAFLLMTLGPAMIIYSVIDRMRMSAANPLIVFGRVPLFYFIGHLFLIHALLYPFVLLRYGTVDFLSRPLPSMGGSLASFPTGFGFGLAVVYGVWILVLAIMYLPCRRFAEVKARGKHRWLQYV